MNELSDLVKEQVSTHRIIKAKKFAEGAHQDQMYGNHLYMYHLNMVSALVSMFGEEARILAYLHDVVEDTEVTLPIISNEFGYRMMIMVDLITDPSGKNRKEKKLEMNKRLSSLDPLSAEDIHRLVLIVKTADRLANTYTCIEEKNKWI